MDGDIQNNSRGQDINLGIGDEGSLRHFDVEIANIARLLQDGDMGACRTSGQGHARCCGPAFDEDGYGGTIVHVSVGFGDSDADPGITM